MQQAETRAAEALAGYPPEIERWLWALEDTRRRRLSLLAGLPPALVDWRPQASANTAGAPLYHSAAIEMDRLYSDILQPPCPAQVDDLFPYDIRDTDRRLSPIPNASLDQHPARLKQSRRSFPSALRPLNIVDVRHQRDLGTCQITLEWVIHHLMQHEAEHRGQPGELLAQAGQERR